MEVEPAGETLVELLKERTQLLAQLQRMEDQVPFIYLDIHPSIFRFLQHICLSRQCQYKSPRFIYSTPITDIYSTLLKARFGNYNPEKYDRTKHTVQVAELRQQSKSSGQMQDAALRRAFNIFDRDGDESLDLEELVNVMKSTY